jgi:hypothetical protein
MLVVARDFFWRQKLRGPRGSLEAGDGLEFVLARRLWTADLPGPLDVRGGSGFLLAKQKLRGPRGSAGSW